MSELIENGQLGVCDFQGEGRSGLWQFDVKSYRLNIVNFKQGTGGRYSSAFLITSCHDGSTEGKEHAILEFFWDAGEVPAPSLSTNEKLLRLNLPVSEFAGVLDLFKGSSPIECYYDKRQEYGGIRHKKAVGRLE